MRFRVLVDMLSRLILMRSLLKRTYILNYNKKLIATE